MAATLPVRGRSQARPPVRCGQTSNAPITDDRMGQWQYAPAAAWASSGQASTAVHRLPAAQQERLIPDTTRAWKTIKTAAQTADTNLRRVQVAV